MNDRFAHLLKDAPPFLSSAQLVALGLFRDKIAIYQARAVGGAPPAIKTAKRAIRFPKQELIAWLQQQNSDSALSKRKGK